MKIYLRILLLIALAFLTLPARAVWSHSGVNGLPPFEMQKIPWQPQSSGDILGVYKLMGDHNLYTSGSAHCITASHLYFRVKDSWAFDLDEKVTITFFSEAGKQAPAPLEYDGFDGKKTLKTYLKPEPQDQPTSNGLNSVTYVLHRARFANQFTGQTDFFVGQYLADQEFSICDIRIERENRDNPKTTNGELKLSVLDEETSAVIPVQMGLYNINGKFIRPSKKAIPTYVGDEKVTTSVCIVKRKCPPPFFERYSFYTDGRYSSELPEGKYTLIISKGPEYRVHEQVVQIQKTKVTDITVRLGRFNNMPEKGWYSSDNHVHISRKKKQNRDILAQMEGADLHLSSLLQMGNLHRTYFDQYDFGPKGYFSRGRYSLVSGQEDPRTNNRGHAILLHLKSAIRLPEEYFLYHHFFAAAHEQDGLVGYAHFGEDFNAQLGLALDVPFNLVDFMEVLQMGELKVKEWYDYLNLGYKIYPTAGNDYPYGDLPGHVRSYVHVDGEFSIPKWFDALKTGNTFVTNGPMLTFSVNDQPMGSEIILNKGQALQIKATTQINPDFGEIKALNLIASGDRMKSILVSSDDPQELSLDFSMMPTESLWLAVVAVGEARGGQMNLLAHSAPVYVLVNGQQRFWKTAVVPELINKKLTYLTDILQDQKYFEPHWDRGALLQISQAHWQGQKAALTARAVQAKEKYADLLCDLEHEKSIKNAHKPVAALQSCKPISK